jgi:hypothetical protein
MTARIPKLDVNPVATAAQTIIDAAKGHERFSPSDLKKALSTRQMPRQQAELVDIFFKFIDAPDLKKGAQLTVQDLGRALERARAHVVETYDLNNNGMSKEEVDAMSNMGKRAVDLAKALKGSTD